jgi:hypothetical protein
LQEEEEEEEEQEEEVISVEYTYTCNPFFDNLRN